jgi:hypothetical protein
LLSRHFENLFEQDPCATGECPAKELKLVADSDLERTPVSEVLNPTAHDYLVGEQRHW